MAFANYPVRRIQSLKWILLMEGCESSDETVIYTPYVGPLEEDDEEAKIKCYTLKLKNPRVNQAIYQVGKLPDSLFNVLEKLQFSVNDTIKQLEEGNQDLCLLAKFGHFYLKPLDLFDKTKIFTGSSIQQYQFKENSEAETGYVAGGIPNDTDITAVLQKLNYVAYSISGEYLVKKRDNRKKFYYSLEENNMQLPVKLYLMKYCERGQSPEHWIKYTVIRLPGKGLDLRIVLQSRSSQRPKGSYRNAPSVYLISRSSLKIESPYSEVDYVHYKEIFTIESKQGQFEIQVIWQYDKTGEKMWTRKEHVSEVIIQLHLPKVQVLKKTDAAEKAVMELLILCKDMDFQLLNM